MLPRLSVRAVLLSLFIFTIGVGLVAPSAPAMPRAAAPTRSTQVTGLPPTIVSQSPTPLRLRLKVTGPKKRKVRLQRLTDQGWRTAKTLKTNRKRKVTVTIPRSTPGEWRILVPKRGRWTKVIRTVRVKPATQSRPASTVVGSSRHLPPAGATTGLPDGVTLKALTAANRPYPADRLSADGQVFTINTPGAVYDGWRFDAFVEVRAPGVRITRSLFRGATSTATDRGLLLVAPGVGDTGTASAVIEDCTFRPQSPSWRIDGIRGSNFTARRLEITGVVDGVHIHGTSSRSDPTAGNVTIERSWIHDLRHFADDPRHSDGSHNDAIQVVGGRNIIVRGNTLVGARNAAMMVKPDRNTIGAVTIDGNWAGNGACTFNLANDPEATMSGIRITNNGFYDNSEHGCAVIISRAISAVITNNVWTSNGAPAKVVKR